MLFYTAAPTPTYYFDLTSLISGFLLFFLSLELSYAFTALLLFCVTFPYVCSVYACGDDTFISLVYNADSSFYNIQKYILKTFHPIQPSLSPHSHSYLKSIDLIITDTYTSPTHPGIPSFSPSTQQILKTEK